MSLITEYNLSFSDIENCTAPRKPRSIKPQQYVQASEYERELLTKLPQLAGTAKPKTEDYVKEEDPGVGLGIKGVGKPSNERQNCTKYSNKERRKGKSKKRQRNGSKFNDDCYDDNEGIRHSEASLLPSVQLKQFSSENKANAMDKPGKTMTELADYFRCYQGNKIRFDHDREKIKNYKKDTDVLLSEVIEKDKNKLRQASKQLERSILRGKGVGHTCTH